MEDLSEFKKNLQQIISRDLPPLSEEEIQRGIREIEALELVGDRWVVWVNKIGILIMEFQRKLHPIHRRL